MIYLDFVAIVPVTQSQRDHQRQGDAAEKQRATWNTEREHRAHTGCDDYSDNQITALLAVLVDRWHPVHIVSL